MKVSNPTRLEDCFDTTATYIHGGTDLMVAINFGHARPEHVMSLRKVGELGAVDVGRSVSIGGGVTYTKLVEALGERSPAMTQAARTIGSPQIRNAGTLGGNLATCSPAGDTLPVLAALDATIVLQNVEGERRLKLDDFMLGPKKPALQPGEVVRAAEWLDTGPSQAFLKAGTRNAMVISVAGLAVVVDRYGRTVRIAIGSAAPTIVRAREAEDFAYGLFDESGWNKPLRASEAALARLGELVAAAADPIDDVRGTAAYRRHVLAVMGRRGVRRAGERVA